MREHEFKRRLSTHHWIPFLDGLHFSMGNSLLLIMAVLSFLHSGRTWPLDPTLEVINDVHHLMNSEELSHYFGVNEASQVIETHYEIINIRRSGRINKWTVDDLDQLENPDIKRNGHDDYVRFSFAANGRNYDLKLRPNNLLISPQMQVVMNTGNGITNVEDTYAKDCHFLTTDGDVVAALSNCIENDVQGYIVDNGRPLEVQPLTPRLRNLVSLKIKSRPEQEENGEIFLGPHLLRVADPIPDFAGNFGCGATPPVMQDDNTTKTHDDHPIETGLKLEVVEKRKGHSVRNHELIARQSATKYLELAVFVDEAAYRTFSPYVGYNDVNFTNLMLAYVNGLQAIYHLETLKTRIELVVVYIEFQPKQPDDLPTFSGERSSLLGSFCAYQKKKNPVGDSNPKHWDMALYVTGLDLFAIENGKRNYITMGLSTVTGVCTDSYNCVIAEFGVVNQLGKPYPSTGFASVYVMAHEMGHNLGMSHDSMGNTCAPEGYIMSPSRGLIGETKWSTCSAQAIQNLNMKCLYDIPAPVLPMYDHSKFGEMPGLYWGADDQCRLLLRDRQASVYNLTSFPDACNSLRCKTLNREGFYLAGPALDGTFCGIGMWCYDGDCIPVSKPDMALELPGNWSDWKSEICSSGCIRKSKGSTISRRYCDSPSPMNTYRGCNGSTIQLRLCDDTNICPVRKLPNDYATKKCADFNKYVPTIIPSGPGIQATYLPDRPWQACAIYCRRNDTNTFYTPRIDLNDIPDVSAYFPDGTWCATVGTKDYYCMQRLCVPGDIPFERFLLQKNAKSLIINKDLEDEFGGYLPEDFDLDILNNAPLSGQYKIPSVLEEYFMLDLKGRTLRPDTDLELLTTVPAYVIGQGKDDNDFITLKP